jgi:hypothetical protein
MRSRFLCIVAAVFCFGSSSARLAASNDDHLVPLSEYELAGTGSGAQYRRLWQQKLLVTPGNVARFARIPGFAAPEVVVCIDKRSAQRGGLPSGYWVTFTEASESLWNCIPTGDEKFTGRGVANARAAKVRRCDAPLPETTARTIHTLWLKMLTKATPLPERCFGVDSPTENFAAINSDGRLLEAEGPSCESKNTSELIRIGFLLLDYCNIDSGKRPELARKIEDRASALLARVSRSKNAKK